MGPRALSYNKLLFLLFLFLLVFFLLLPLQSSSLSPFRQKFSPVKTLEEGTTTEKWEFDSVLMEFVFFKKIGNLRQNILFWNVPQNGEILAAEEKALPSHDFVSSLRHSFRHWFMDQRMIMSGWFSFNLQLSLILPSTNDGERGGDGRLWPIIKWQKRVSTK